MKIKIDKNTITLSEVEQAKKLIGEWNWIDNDTVESFAIHASKLEGTNTKLIRVEEIEVTKNHFELTIWCTALIESYDCIARTSFDLLQANNWSWDRDDCTIDNFTQYFDKRK